MNNYFLKMIEQLWRHEEIMLYGNCLKVEEIENREVLAFLQKAYQREILDYPFTAPAFNEEAALWGAKTIYLAAQFLLYRENKVAELPMLFPAYDKTITSSAVLSADLCLRFLPELIKELKVIDREDPLIKILEKTMKDWHYSGVNYPMAVGDLSFEVIEENPCLHQLYANRVISYKNQKLANHESLKDLINSNLGDHQPVFWSTKSNTKE